MKAILVFWVCSMLFCSLYTFHPADLGRHSGSPRQRSQACEAKDNFCRQRRKSCAANGLVGQLCNTSTYSSNCPYAASWTCRGCSLE